MKLSNKCMLITYADSLGENLQDLKEVLDTHLDKAVGGVHILPFFPSSADRGFAPMRYDIVDPDFGDWADVKAIGDDRYLMFDFMINHLPGLPGQEGRQRVCRLLHPLQGLLGRRGWLPHRRAG